MSILVRAPSNIALIKYMGKTDVEKNLPDNSSLSMTLDRLSTYMKIDFIGGAAGEFKLRSGFDPLPAGVSAPYIPEIKGAGLEKMLKHWKRITDAMPGFLEAAGLRARVEGPHAVTLQTLNTFPMGSGIASSASSFAALTLAGLMASVHEQDAEKLRTLWKENSARAIALKRQCAKISRQGSGSSCRSFEGPWVEWSNEDALAFETAMPEMAHFVVVLSKTEKQVSSSQAHQRVKTSPQWAGRVARVNQRFDQMKAAMTEGNVAKVARLAWTEMWEMHNLFHTAAEPFSYWLPGTINALHTFADDILSSHPPIVTLDAGPNLHVLVPKADRVKWLKTLQERFGPETLLSDEQGSGAEIL
jgi:diphosphomevalonate decarboxylase